MRQYLIMLTISSFLHPWFLWYQHLLVFDWSLWSLLFRFLRIPLFPEFHLGCCLTLYTFFGNPSTPRFLCSCIHWTPSLSMLPLQFLLLSSFALPLTFCSSSHILSEYMVPYPFNNSIQKSRRHLTFSFLSRLISSQSAINSIPILLSVSTFLHLLKTQFRFCYSLNPFSGSH